MKIGERQYTVCTLTLVVCFAKSHQKTQTPVFPLHLIKNTLSNIRSSAKLMFDLPES